MNYISLIGLGIFVLAWTTYVVVWVIEVYRCFRTEPRMRPITSLSDFYKTTIFKLTLAFMAITGFGWVILMVGAKVR